LEFAVWKSENMSLPVRHLPVVQNWDCHSCSNCCREYDVAVSDEERKRIEAQGWDADRDIGGLPLFARTGFWWSRTHRLSHRGDRGCVFLTHDNRCRIHERFGHEAKPLACRLFPFLLVPAGDHWRVGLRFACPSAAANQGRPLTEHIAELNRLGDQYEQRVALQLQVGELPPPPLQGRRQLNWSDFLRLVKTLQTILSDRRDRVERRLRKCLELVRVCREARFDAVQGRRLDEFLEILAAALDDSVPAAPATVPPPGWVGRVLFRQLAALYGRKDRGEQRGLAGQGRLALLHAGYRFAVGRGPVPRLNARIGRVTFEEVDAPTGPLPPGAEEALERYYLLKLTSLQFCGPTNFRRAFWAGLESLILTYPVIVWLSRAMRPEPIDQAIVHSLGVVDDHFGFNPVLRRGRYQLAHNIIAAQGELPRLIAWYSR
jgi:lysine-N-methylase